MQSKTVSVQVTRHDIGRGKRGNCYECPVAMAVARATGRMATVGRRWVTLASVIIELPVYVQKWIQDYDAGLPVPAFEFAVIVPG